MCLCTCSQFYPSVVRLRPPLLLESFVLLLVASGAARNSIVPLDHLAMLGSSSNLMAARTYTVSAPPPSLRAIRKRLDGLRVQCGSQERHNTTKMVQLNWGATG